MTPPKTKFVQCISPAGLHMMAYKEWGDPANTEVVVCVHGVTRVSDDFDYLARTLCDKYRVICPDVVGRGRSEWLRDPQHYQIPQYVNDMVTLIARVLPDANEGKINWVGTSMGGLIGMGLAALTGNPIKKLVLNDVGPVLNPAALLRIGDYIGQAVHFPTFEAGEQYIRDISKPFGPHSDEEWHKLAADVLRQDENGRWIRHYDLKLAQPFKAATPESLQQSQALLWATYDAIRCPTLLLRGTDSDLLSPESAHAMTQRGPHAKLVEFTGVGHAPTLVHENQIAVVADFLKHS